MAADPTVFIVEDDDAVRDSLKFMLEYKRFTVKTFRDARVFLDAYEPHRPGCLIVDVCLPGMSGLELQSVLLAHQINLPVIIITGQGDVPMAVAAMKAHAIDFIEKPFEDRVLLNSIRRALAICQKDWTNDISRAEVADRLARLTTRERNVLDLVVAGRSNKGIARVLGISHRTVENHRARVNEKMQAESLSHLVRMVLATGTTPEH